MDETQDAPLVQQRTPLSVAIAGVRALRPHQWTKNSLLFAALVFSGEFLQIESIVEAVIGFAAFSALASAGYILNDYLDREADRKHPRKRKRAIASGALPPWAAIAELIVLIGIGTTTAYALSPMFLAIALLYLGTTLSYSFFLKHIVIIDVMFLASGFVWRAIAGAVAIDVDVSPWLFLCTAFLALFLGFEKRRGELRMVGEGGGTRKILAEYSPEILLQFQSIVTTSALLSYALYSVLGPTPWMALTVPYVLYGIFRYIYLVERHGEGAAPDETLFRDRPMQVTILVYGLTAMGILYAMSAGLI